MATQDMLAQLIQGVVANPQLLGNFSEHPYSTIREATGTTDELSRQDASELLAAFTGLAGGQSVDFGNLGTAASGMLADSGNSVHSLAANLFGGLLGGAASGAAEKTSSAGGVGDIIQNLVKALASSEFSGVKGLDLSDGFGMDDVIGIAKNLL